MAEVLAGARAGAVIESDNLDALAGIPDGGVDLVYADPPFATGGASAAGRWPGR
jgi:16S rRNA G966 N2-methylase RsmD